MAAKPMLSIVAALLFVRPLLAYEPNVVHYRMTEAAFDAASAQNDFLKRLGITDATRLAGKLPRTWAAEGGRDEDWMTNPLSHFFDPENGIELSVGPCPKFPIPSAQRADLYAVGSVLNNRNGLGAARLHYRQALTASSRAARERALGDTFRTIGHMMHLVEDMAQPEHTRNDNHGPWPIGNGSRYEDWTHTLISNPASMNRAPGNYFTGYPVVHLRDYVDYFSHRATRRGMADYSHDNFVTQDTNFNDPSRECPRFDYALPALPQTSRDEHRFVDVKIPIGPFYRTQSKLVKLTFFDAVPNDRYQTMADPARPLTVRSYLDFETKIYLDPSDPTAVAPFSENDDVYLHKAERLLPRAVGYAAGLLNHFFRGKVDVTWISGTDPYFYEVDIENQSSEILLDATMQVFLVEPGAAAGIIKVVDVPLPALGVAGTPTSRVRMPVALSGIILGPDQSIFEFERRIVIEGTLGQEEHALIGAVQPGSRGSVVAFHGIPPNAEFARVHLGGSGTIETIRPLVPGDWPRQVFGAQGALSLSPDGELLAFEPEGAPTLLAIASLDGSQAWVVTPQTFDGKTILLRGARAWSRDSRRIAAYASQKCEPTPCGVDGSIHGIAVIDIHSGFGSFQPAPQLTKTFLQSHNLLNTGRLSPDGSTLFVAEPCCGLASRLIRLGVFSGSVEVGPAGRTLYDFEVTFDGRLIGTGRNYGQLTFEDGLFEVTWPSSWTKLTDIYHLNFGSMSLSPNQGEIAYVKQGCAGYQIWTFNRSTGVASPGADACGASSPYFFSMLRWTR